ncbi:uncharacterized protein FPRO_14659 [Fusarium proliferatum ET1]|uniref:Uncharacterized protein n=1 Tax=Fusarium proliferatum (strain ET1) TaxID=1227346 RepID=A0A1L7VWT9_FUSPR|nr:uncharacterized protein FPRO_14659 [Fusarium proliferatum ET1]CZR44907.1 uncharacterized protein FPRO_14659 [Fusarium proliferatum ET1]
MTSNGTEFVGWTPSPDGRGTYDIIATCLVTTFLCCWTSVYPNIPAPGDGFWSSIRDKLGLACMGLLGPEFIIVLAIGQKSSARRSVVKFKQAGYTQWTITHGFFADMGGFVLEASDLRQPIPLNAEQLFYLVNNSYVDYPSTSDRELKDRNKSDGLARLITLWQGTWFIITFIARLIQGLHVTTMELTAVSFVIILFGTAWCWKDKPSDVGTTITVPCRTTMEDILIREGRQPDQPYYQTPLDFISRDETALNLAWQYYNELSRKILFSPFSRRVKQVPWDRNPGDIFLRMDFDLELVGVAFIFVFSAVFLGAWNFSFPSTVERDFWRVASAYMLAYGMFGALWMELCMWIFIPQYRLAEGLELSLVEQALDQRPHPVRNWHHRFQNWRRSRFSKIRGTGDPDGEGLTSQRPKKGIFAFLSRTYNISQGKDPHLGVQVGFLIVTSFLCASYCVFRLFIFVEDFIGLRALPQSAYQTVEWAEFIPHI